MNERLTPTDPPAQGAISSFSLQQVWGTEGADDNILRIQMTRREIEAN